MSVKNEGKKKMDLNLRIAEEEKGEETGVKNEDGEKR